jgi:hypothetical protein
MVSLSSLSNLGKGMSKQQAKTASRSAGERSTRRRRLLGTLKCLGFGGVQGEL